MGSSPSRPTCGFIRSVSQDVDRIVDRCRNPVCRHAVASTPSGHIEQLPSGSWRAKVYAGTDPLTGREIRFRKTCKTERAAQIELGKLLAMAQAGRQPDSDVTVVQLLDQYVSTAGWDVSTLQSNLGYIRRTIKPALGSLQVRKVRGPILNTLYARLMRCGNLACTGKPFTEHRNLPDLRPDPADRRLEWEQAADRVRAAIRSGQLTSGDTLPSVPELARLQGLKRGTVRHAFLVLAKEGLVHVRHGRTTTIAGESTADEPGTRRQITRPRPGHDCTLSGCRPHVCKPMAKGTIRGIHAKFGDHHDTTQRPGAIPKHRGTGVVFPIRHADDGNGHYSPGPPATPGRRRQAEGRDG